MSGTFREKNKVLSEVDAVSTTELCRLLGVNLSAERLEELGEVKPVFISATGRFWRRDHVPLIGLALASHLIRISGDMLHIQQAEAGNVPIAR